MNYNHHARIIQIIFNSNQKPAFFFNFNQSAEKNECEGVAGIRMDFRI